MDRPKKRKKDVQDSRIFTFRLMDKHDDLRVAAFVSRQTQGEVVRRALALYFESLKAAGHWVEAPPVDFTQGCGGCAKD